MKKIKMLVAVVLAVLMLTSIAVVTTNAAVTAQEKTGASGITVHFYRQFTIGTVCRRISKQVTPVLL